MKFKYFLICLVLLLVVSCVPEITQAQSQNKSTILIVYNANTPLEEKTVHRVDALFSSYGDTVVEPIRKMTKQQVNEAATIIYIGMNEAEISQEHRQWMQKFPRQKLFIGYNANQFEAFRDLRIAGTDDFVQIDSKTLTTKIPFLKTTSNYKEVIEGKTIQQKYPVLLKNGKHYYLSLNKWSDEFQLYLQPFIANKTTSYQPPKHRVWMILDGIRPSTSPKQLKAVTNQLEKENVPYALAIAAVEYTADRKSVNQLNDAKELRDVLQEEQAKGVAIIANGYGLSYRPEDKKQHEFWDDELNQPITALNSTQAKPFYTVEEFSSNDAFQEARQKNGQIEKQYTKQRIQEAVSALSRAKLYPIAFTIENGQASSYVYEEIAHHFTTYFGTLQYSDESSEFTGVQPLLTTPSYMHHLEVYSANITPITSNLESEPILIQQLKNLTKIQGSMAGMKINIQQKPEEIARTLAVLNTFPQFEWLDLRKINTKVQVTDLTITQSGTGKLTVKQENRYIDLIKYKWETSPFEFSLWVLFGIVLLFVALFFLNVLRLRFTLKKRLFEERKPNG